MNHKAVYRTAPATPGLINILYHITAPQDQTIGNGAFSHKIDYVTQVQGIQNLKFASLVQKLLNGWICLLVELHRIAYMHRPCVGGV